MLLNTTKLGKRGLGSAKPNMAKTLQFRSDLSLIKIEYSRVCWTLPGDEHKKFSKNRWPGSNILILDRVHRHYVEGQEVIYYINFNKMLIPI